MAPKLICFVVFLTVYNAAQAYPMYPYGPFGYPSPYGLSPYSYGLSFRRGYGMGGVPGTGAVSNYRNVPAAPAEPIDIMQRSIDEFVKSMNRMQGEKTSFREVIEIGDKPQSDEHSKRSLEAVSDTPQLSTTTEVLAPPQLRQIPEVPQLRELPEYRELPGDKIKTRAENDDPLIVMRSGVPKMRSVSIENSKENSSESDSVESKEVKENKPMKQPINENPDEEKSTQLPSARTIFVKNDSDSKEIKRNTLELDEEYDHKRERETEWDQSDYDNFDWEDNNDIDEIKVYNELPKKWIDLRGDTYVNDLLAAKGAKINPDAEFIPPRTSNNEREEIEYEGILPHQRQRNYYDDTNVNNILESRNTAINPDAEFIPPSSKYSTPIEVHYGYEIDDFNNLDLSRDTEVNNILAARGAPINPDSEMIDPNYTENKNRGPASRYHGQYSGDTYINEILKRQGAPMNPNAESFTPEEFIEFVPLETEQSDFKNNLRRDINVDKFSEGRETYAK